MPMQEIDILKMQFVRVLGPAQIYLFGSYADGTYQPHSDFDFYIVIDDENADFVELTAKAYRAIRDVKQRPVDIIVGSRSRFESRKNIPSVEKEVAQKGVLLYAA